MFRCLEKLFSFLEARCSLVDLGGANEDSLEQWKRHGPKFIRNADFDVDKSELFLSQCNGGDCLPDAWNGNLKEITSSATISYDRDLVTGWCVFKCWMFVGIKNLFGSFQTNLVVGSANSEKLNFLYSLIIGEPHLSFTFLCFQKVINITLFESCVCLLSFVVP